MFIPNLLKKQKIPEKIPKELEEKIKEFSKKNNKEDFLKKSFFYIVGKWKGNRINLLLKFSRLFEKEVDKILCSKGYQHCTNMNFLLRVMALKSGLFDDEDIELKVTHTGYLFPHQYLEVRLNKSKKIALDPWNYQFGINFGDFGSGFKTLRFNPIR